MRSAVSELNEIDLGEVEAAVGSRSFKRGTSYARANRVIAIEWDADTQTLTGSVVGQGALYDTAAFFATGSRDALTFDDGECTCPVGYNCKHVAAIVIAASDGHRVDWRRGKQRAPRAPIEARPTTRQAAHIANVDRDRPATRQAVQPEPWEHPLRALIDAPATRAAGNPLAIELALRATAAGSGEPRLMARLMREGARGGWINGSLSWSGLDSWHVRDGEYRPDHLALARELYAAHRAREGRTGYYSYGADKTLDLSDCDSVQLWSLLDEAARLGLKLLHASPGLGEVRHHRRGELLIDVTRGDDQGAVVSPILQVHGEAADDLEPLLFVGASGHGLVCVERDDGDNGGGGGGGSETAHEPEDRRLALVRLLKPAPAALQRMVLDGGSLRIPASELGRFAEELCPALRHVATVASSDGSFTPPEISAPALVLRASYGANHAVEVGWEWAYQVGEAHRRAALASNEAGPGFRDLDAERAILATTDLAGTDLERLGLLDVAGRPAEERTTSLTGIDSMRLTTEMLPRLTERSDVIVEIVGESADYRDVGDSLTIGLSTAEIAEERDWFDLGVSISVDGRELGFAEVFTALASGESQMLLDDGAHFSLLAPELQELRRLIEEARALTDSPSGSLRISRYQAGLWAELAALGVVREQAQAWQRQVDALLELDALTEHEQPATLQAQLRPYQREGFGWLASLGELELGGILADDMGLGKTLQVLALIAHARERDPNTGPFLVVAPTSVVPGWVAEAARFTPGLDVSAVTDTLARSGRTIEEVASADVVVTTYTLFRLEADAYRTVAWAGLILDEAQYVKNHQAKTYRCVRELPTPFKLAMTGTPMENNLMELWSLLSIAAPGLFPDPTRFAEQYARPIERGGDAERLARLRRRIKPLIKRRTKELVAADLPDKQEQTLDVNLHPRHRKLYDTRLQRERQKILGLIGDFNRHRFTILRSITLLRQLSLHPGLIDDDHDAMPCAKLGALVQQLEEVVSGGHRALVFSQFTGFLAKARERLEHEGIDYCYLDGRTRRRERVLQRFKDGADPVFLISLKAGGFGLNLTEADYCFLLDPWWNPATEAQAIDRTHRIGQTRPVNVYRMISRNTIEEKVAALARRKAALFSGVMDDGDLFANSLTAEDIRGLLG
ncbi:MAG: SNF2-related protein [Solirubrobacteraceae bacterium]